MKEDNEDVNPAETPSPSADVPSAPSAESTPQPETPPAKPDAKVSNREALIAKLTAKKEQDPETDEPEEPETPDKAPVTPEPESKKDNEPAPEKAPETPDEGEPSEAELQHYSANAQNRIRQALKRAKAAEAKVKDSEGLAGFGADIIDRAQKAGVPPQVFVDWVDTGAEIFSNPQTGVQRLVQMAEALGYKPATTPAIPEGFDKLLSKLEEDLEISPDAAKVLRARLKPAEQPTPPAAPTAPVQQLPPRQMPDANRAAMDVAVREMNKLSAELAQVHGAAWPEIEAAAAKKLEKYKGSPTHMWPGLFRDAVTLAVAERKAAAPALKPITKTLRPTTAPPGKEAPKSNRERVLQKYT